jgi:hypothetical protein
MDIHAMLRIVVAVFSFAKSRRIAPIDFRMGFLEAFQTFCLAPPAKLRALMGENWDVWIRSRVPAAE